MCVLLNYFLNWIMVQDEIQSECTADHALTGSSKLKCTVLKHIWLVPKTREFSLILE